MEARGEDGVKSFQGFEAVTVRVEQPGIAWIILEGGPRGMSTIGAKTIEELSRALDLLEKEDAVRVLIVKGGTEKAFSAGADISGFQASSKTGESSRRGQIVFGKFENFPRPVIAAIRGYCVGGGLELAMACDFRIASSDAKLGLVEISLGLLPGWGGTQRMTRLLGQTKAKELIMFGKRISAEEALSIGLVNSVFPNERFDEEVRAFALDLAAKAPIALGLAKRAINVAHGGTFEAGLEVEARSFAIAMQTEDAKEGIESFFAKKKPVFKGQ